MVKQLLPDSITIEKINKIQNYEDKELLEFINEIDSSKYIDDLKLLLDHYVPKTLRNKKNNKEKYGDSTRKNFIKAFKKVELDTIEKAQSCAEIAIYHNLFFIWTSFQSERFNFESNSDFDFNDEYINTLIKKNNDKEVPKEIILKIYKMCLTIEEKEQLEESINKCQYTLEEYNAEITNKQKIEDLNNENLRLKKENEELKSQNNEEKTSNNKSKISKVEYNKLLSENNGLKSQLENKDKEIDDLKQQLEPYSNIDLNELKTLQSKFDKLNDKFKNLKNTRLTELENQIKTNKNLQGTILRLILNEDRISNAIITSLNLRENVDEYKKYEQTIEELEKKQKELEVKNNKLNEQLNKLREDIKEYNYSKAFSSMLLEDENELNVDNFAEKYEKLTPRNKNYRYKPFLMLDDRKVIDDIKDEYGKKVVCEVIPEATWTGIEDWYGKCDEDGNFYPAKTTYVADYYNYIAEDPENRYGLVIFNDFNKIIPEIYLEPFIKSLEIKDEYQIHQNHTIDGNVNLKYVFIKSKDSNAFEVPDFIKKYEM